MLLPEYINQVKKKHSPRHNGPASLVLFAKVQPKQTEFFQMEHLQIGFSFFFRQPVSENQSYLTFHTKTRPGQGSIDVTLMCKFGPIASNFGLNFWPILESLRRLFSVQNWMLWAKFVHRCGLATLDPTFLGRNNKIK